MFGIGFSEMLLIAVIAILFLGPDKLPETMVSIAKFIKKTKKGISDAKQALESEMHIEELKSDALSYKEKLDKSTQELKGFSSLELDDILDSEPLTSESPEVEAFKKESSKLKNKAKIKES